MKTTVIVVAALLAVAAGPAHARKALQGVALNGVSLNGTMNGLSLNGAMNGVSLNGAMNGLSLNGHQTQGMALNGTTGGLSTTMSSAVLIDVELPRSRQWSEP